MEPSLSQNKKKLKKKTPLGQGVFVCVCERSGWYRTVHSSLSVPHPNFIRPESYSFAVLFSSCCLGCQEKVCSLFVNLLLMMYFYFCLHVFPVFYTIKKYTTTVGTITLTCELLTGMSTFNTN